MDLWTAIIETPESIASAYEKLWKAQQGRERRYYDLVRSEFNETHKAEHLLYLLARCVKASIRYNVRGQFNQSPDNRRLGMNPETMQWHINAASQLLKGRVVLRAVDYLEVLTEETRQDIVYMDPPYQGVCANRDPRYSNVLAFESFVVALREMNRRDISFILSYDGRTGDKAHGKPMPPDLALIRLEINVGRSSQATLLGRTSNTIESLYLSPALVARIEAINDIHLTLAPKQFRLWAHDGSQQNTLRIPSPPQGR